MKLPKRMVLLRHASVRDQCRWLRKSFWIPGDSQSYNKQRGSVTMNYEWYTGNENEVAFGQQHTFCPHVYWNANLFWWLTTFRILLKLQTIIFASHTACVAMLKSGILFLFSVANGVRATARLNKCMAIWVEKSPYPKLFLECWINCENLCGSTPKPTVLSSFLTYLFPFSLIL